MKKLILTTTALALSASMAFAGGHGKTVRMGTEGAYPPYNFINDKGEVDGFERELGDELCKRAQLTCEWVTNEWDSIIPNLVSGNYDTIIAGMSITAERDEVIGRCRSGGRRIGGTNRHHSGRVRCAARLDTAGICHARGNRGCRAQWRGRCAFGR
jgi:hypothetical protein